MTVHQYNQRHLGTTLRLTWIRGRIMELLMIFLNGFNTFSWQDFKSYGEHEYKAHMVALTLPRIGKPSTTWKPARDWGWTDMKGSCQWWKTWKRHHNSLGFILQRFIDWWHFWFCLKMMSHSWPDGHSFFSLSLLLLLQAVMGTGVREFPASTRGMATLFWEAFTFGSCPTDGIKPDAFLFQGVVQYLCDKA